MNLAPIGISKKGIRGVPAQQPYLSTRWSSVHEVAMEPQIIAEIIVQKSMKIKPLGLA